MIKFSTWVEHFIVLPGGKPIELQSHQVQILDHVFTPDDNGKFPYTTVIYSAPKKSGKTGIEAIVMAYFGFNIEAPNEIICAANKADQAISKAFREMKGFITRNHNLKGEIVRQADDRLELKNGTILQAIPNNAAGEAGSNHGLTVWDEIWGFNSERDRQLYEELTPVPTRKNSIRFIGTYAGYEGQKTILEDLYHEIFDANDKVKEDVTRPLGEDLPCYAKGDLFVYWDHEPRMPWQTTEYYASQRRSLRPNTYLRLHENRWVSNESGLFDMEKWDRCVDPSHRPPMSTTERQIMLYVGVDASLKKDRSAVVSVYKDENGRLMLGPKRFWQPSKANPMDLEATMEAFLLDLHRGYCLRTVRYDPYQFHRSAMTLRNKGLPMEEFPQVTGNLTDMGQNIYDLVEYRNIVLYACKDLRYEATCAIAKETERGIQITKVKSSQKIDQIVALAMAALPAVKEQVCIGEAILVGRSIAARASWGADLHSDHDLLTLRGGDW
jgi:phage terminase large subunit-like protein